MRLLLRHILVPNLFCLVGLSVIAAPAFAQRTRKPIAWVNSDFPDFAGLEHKVLKSDALGHDLGYAVWTPPGISADADTHYPVVYFSHDAGRSE